MFKPNRNILIDSENNIFIFDLTIDGNVNCKQYDSNLNLIGSNRINEATVMNYSVTIDRDNTIHLITLTNAGELHYYKYSDGKWNENTIAKFNLLSNIYNQFEVLLINDKLHLIYNYSNLINSNIWTIQHIVYDNGREEQYNVVRYISKKTPEPFIVDADNLGNIHLLYLNYINNSSQVYYSFYSFYGKMWNPHPKLLSSDNVNNLTPYLFIDSNNNIHCVWIEDLSYKMKLKLMKMHASGKEKYQWKEVPLPNVSISKGYPFIYETNGNLNLVLISNNKIISLESKDYGYKWYKSEKELEFRGNMELVKLKLSPLNYPDKINLIYMEEGNDEKINILHHFLNFNSSSLKEKHDNKEISDENNYTAILQSQTEPELSIPSYILDLTNKIDDLLTNQLALNAYLEKAIHSQENIIKKLDIIESLIKDSNSKSIWARIFNKY